MEALVASMVNVALALSAVSGVTYSWFSDTEQSDIKITTAKVDHTVGWRASGSNDVGTKWTVNDGVVTITGLAANAVIPVIESITDDSTIKTVYKISATAELASGHNYTLYDLKNIYIGGKQLNVSSDGSTITLGETVIVDWTLLNVNSNPTMQTVSITTPQTYGCEDASIVAYNPTTGEGFISKTGAYTAEWINDVGEGLAITLSVVAAHGDYPYTQMDTTTATASAVIPTNKVVKADSIASSESGSTDAVSNVVLDFSNVSKATDFSSNENNITGTKVTAKVTSISSTDSTVTIDLNLYSVSGETSTQNTCPQFDAPVVITMTVPGEITEPKITYNGVEDGKILSSTINSDNTTTVVFSVEHFSKYVIADTLVMTAEGLQASLNVGGYVKLGNSIDVQGQDNEDGTAFVSEESGTVLDLNRYTISTNMTCLIDVQESLGIRNGELKCDYTDGGRVINIDGDPVEKQGSGAAENMTLTLKDVDVVGPTGDVYNRGISVLGTKDLTINTDFPFYAVMMFWGSGYFQSPRTSLSHR